MMSLPTLEPATGHLTRWGTCPGGGAGGGTAAADAILATRVRVGARGTTLTLGASRLASVRFAAQPREVRERCRPDRPLAYPIRASAASSRAISACAAARRSRFSSTTSSGARRTKSALSSFCATFSRLAGGLVALLRQPRPFRGQVDQPRPAAGPPSPRPAPPGPSLSASRPPAASAPRRAPGGGSRRSSAAARASVSGAASRSRIGAGVPGGTFISARTARTSVISRTTQSSSARAAAASGHRDRRRPGRADQAARRAVAETVPQLLGDERHRRMQQAQDRCPAHAPPCARTSRRLGAVALGQHRLGELQEPVAERVPGETVAGGGVFVEAVGFQRRRSPRATASFAASRIQRVSGSVAARRIERRIGRDPVHLAEPRGVPQLGDEAAVALHPRRASFTSRPGPVSAQMVKRSASAP